MAKPKNSCGVVTDGLTSSDRPALGTATVRTTHTLSEISIGIFNPAAAPPACCVIFHSAAALKVVSARIDPWPGSLTVRLTKGYRGSITTQVAGSQLRILRRESCCRKSQLPAALHIGFCVVKRCLKTAKSNRVAKGARLVKSGG